MIDYCVIKEDFIDKELANVFLYKSENTFDDFTLQAEEVSGILKAKFNDFTELWLGERETIEIMGFEINKDGNKSLIKEFVGMNKFVPHQISFYKVSKK